VYGDIIYTIVRKYFQYRDQLSCYVSWYTGLLERETIFFQHFHVLHTMKAEATLNSDNESKDICLKTNLNPRPKRNNSVAKKLNITTQEESECTTSNTLHLYNDDF
jgi:hypothetical protein